MLSKNQIKLIRSLEQKKFRKETGLFVAEGKKIANEIMNSQLKVQSVFATQNYIFPETPKIPVTEISEEELKKISFLTTPNEVLCVVEIPRHEIDFSEIKTRLSIFLENIKDPGNMGNIMRIADWFGIEHIFCSPGCVDAYNPKTVQASMGSVARIKVFYEEAEKIISGLKNTPTEKPGEYKIYAAVLNGKNIYHEKLCERGLIIFGNESDGISEALLQLSDEKISVPRFGKAESLNVAASAAVICSEFAGKSEVRSRKSND